MRRMAGEAQEEISVGVTIQEGMAIERCLGTELDLVAGSHHRMRVIHFDRPLPRTAGTNQLSEHALEVCATERSSSPDTVELTLKRVLSDEHRLTKVELPRQALRAALRSSALAELLPDAPSDLVPVLGVEFTRRAWRHASGWCITLDRDIAFHRIDPRVLERTGRIALGVPDRFAEGKVLLTLRPEGATPPAWLMPIVRASPLWNLREEGLNQIAPRPQVHTPSTELRLVVH